MNLKPPSLNTKLPKPQTNNAFVGDLNRKWEDGQASDLIVSAMAVTCRVLSDSVRVSEVLSSLGLRVSCSRIEEGLRM